MIKFFRRIRQQLLSENKFSKYLFYAIGEIILVVIGILIALQINNWNESKKAKEKEHQVLTEIISDLEYSITDLYDVKSVRKINTTKSINALKTLIKVMQTNQKYHDSLTNEFIAANAYDEADFKISGYNSLSSIGMDLVQNNKMRSTIGEFYTSTIPDYEEAYNEIRQDFHEYMLDYLRKDFTLKNIGSEDRKVIPNDFEALKKDKEYIQSLRTFLDVKIYYLNKLNITLKKAEQLKKDIENYLND